MFELLLLRHDVIHCEYLNENTTRHISNVTLQKAFWFWLLDVMVFVWGGRRASSDPLLESCAAESESAAHDGRTGMKEEPETETHTHVHTHSKASRGGMFRSSALHLFSAKYNQRNPGLTFPLLCTTSWVGQRMEEEEKKEPGRR